MVHANLRKQLHVSVSPDLKESFESVAHSTGERLFQYLEVERWECAQSPIPSWSI